MLRSLFAFGVVLVCATLTSNAQHSAHTTTGSTYVLPVLVDGSKTPESIPDDLAWEHYFIAVSEKPNAGPVERERQKYKLRWLQLPEADRDKLIDELGRFRLEYERIERLRTQVSEVRTSAPSATLPQIDAVRAMESQLSASTLKNLGSLLSEEGRKKLETFVKTDVKRRIVIYGNQN